MTQEKNATVKRRIKMHISIADLPERYRAQIRAKVNLKKISKYHNEKTNIDGIPFDSKKEAHRFIVLRELLLCGNITDLRLQHTFMLQEPYTTPSGKRIRGITYKADFTYWQNGEFVVEDVKSPVTRKKSDYRMKVKMMQDKLGIDVVEV